MDLLKDEVRDLSLRPGMRVSEIVDQMGKAGGFTARFIYEAVSVLEEMIRDKESVNFLAFPAALVSTGIRGVLRDMVGRGYFDVVITTGGTVDHDMARCYASYYQGYFEADDTKLHERGVHRLGNVFIPLESYGPLIEKLTRELVMGAIAELGREFSPSELLHYVGGRMCEESILRAAHDKGVPVFSPGLLDSSFGTALSLMREETEFHLDFTKDMLKLAHLSFDMRKSGALILGGGISKHHTIWWNQFKGGLDYVVYVTTAVEWDGSLSGAREREAISWGKVSARARRAFVPGEVTALLPFMYVALLERLSDFSREGRYLTNLK